MERRNPVAEFMQITGLSERRNPAEFMEITGVSESVAVQNLEEYRGNLNDAINAQFLKGDWHISPDQAEMREGPWINEVFQPHYQNIYPLAMSNTIHDPDAELEMLQAAIKASTVEGRGGSPREQIHSLDDSSDDGLPQSHFQQEDDELAHAIFLSLEMTKQENAMREHPVVEEKERLGAHDLLDKGKKISSSRSQLQGEKKKLAPDASSTLEKMSMFDPGLKKSTEKENSSIIPPDEAQDISEDIKQKSIAVASLGKSDIPNEDLDFDPKTTFSDPESDEDAKEECFFGILKEWSSGPSISRRALESDSGSHKTELEAKLSSFRELAYSDNFAVALSQPNFKTKIETTIEDLKSVNDMPAEIQSELKEFVLVFNKAFDLHLKNFLVRESIEKIENDTAEDREKLAVVRTQVTSLKQSIKQIGPSLEKFKKQEQDFLMTIEALQRKLSTNQAMQKNIQDEKNTMNKKHADLIDQARAISESLQEQLESKRKLEKDHSFLLTSLQQEVKHHQELKEKYFH